jgi:uncharacterized YigZ family protein
LDSYKTIAEKSEGAYKDKGSKFLAFAFPVDTMQDVELSLENIRKIHPKARHHCYAWKIGHDGNQYRANDDGEPSGTAGKPIHGQLISHQLTNILVIVVRYFGGTLLGTPGLIKAYKEATIDALKNALVIEKAIEIQFEIIFDYAWMSDVMNALKKLPINILEQEFIDGGRVVCSIVQSKSPYFIDNFKALVLKKTVEEVQGMEEIEGIEMKLYF